MRESSLDFLKTLVNTPSPSGHEVRGQRVWIDYVKQFANETFSDAYGNCVASLNKGGSPRLMLAAHADEIAMAVNFITDEGFIYVRKLGGIDAAITKAQRVVIHTRNGPVKGVVGNVAPHLTRVDKDRKLPEIHDLFIDIAVGNRKEAEKLVRIGDPITLCDEFELLRDDLAVARAFDNRIGTFGVVARLESVAKQKKIDLQHEAQSSTSGTDTDVIFWTRGGIPSALISLPNRYMHSPVELVSLKDLGKIPELMAGFALSLKRNEEFKVKI